MPYEMLTDAEICKPIDNFAYRYSYQENEKVSFKMLPDIYIPNFGYFWIYISVSL